MVYEGSGGYICYEYKGGRTDDDRPGITVFGVGTEDQDNPTNEADRINGVTEFDTAAADADSVGLHTPRSWRGRIDQYGLPREANGPLVTKCRFGLPAKDDMSLFFGIVDTTSGSQNIDSILTYTAAGAITSVYDNFAGFFYGSGFTNDADQLRCVAINDGGGNKDATQAPVLIPQEIGAASAYMNLTPELSPTLEVEVTHDGNVDFRYNGEIVRRAIGGVNPEDNYAAVVLIQTDEAVAKSIGIDFFRAEWQRYYGPVVP